MKKPKLLIALIAFIVILSSMTIDLQNLFNYANQSVPTYITKDNTAGNVISDEGATLGRVLFYDKKLSSNNMVACASCHHQQFAFGDTAWISPGVNGNTARHSMRLVNNRFADEQKFFWDERAETLEDQVLMPFQDDVEMGLTLPELVSIASSQAYYPPLFEDAFGDELISSDRISKALAQFVRSLVSVTSKYDQARTAVQSPMTDFPSFTAQENQGKRLFYMEHKNTPGNLIGPWSIVD